MLREETAEARNYRLTGDLRALLAWKADYRTRAAIDVVITSNEVNERHGTGVLVKRILGERPNIFSIRFRDDWGGDLFGEWSVRLNEAGLNREAAFRNILKALGGHRIASVLCVPFLTDEPLAAIAIHEIFGARLCAYVMDDHNIADQHIPDAVMREFLTLCSLRFATHPELRAAYERKFKLPFFLLPAVAPDALILRDAAAGAPEISGKRGVMIGSFWDQVWFDRLCEALETAGCAIDWFGNTFSKSVDFSEDKLKRAGIVAHGLVSEKRLAEELRRYPFVIVPAGMFNASEKNRSVASLSLPGRILFAAAVSRTPILVVGSRDTCASRFVRHFEIGETADYDGASIRAAIARLQQSDTQRRLRANAARVGEAFSDRGLVEWLARSVELGRAADDRFEKAFANYDANQDAEGR